MGFTNVMCLAPMRVVSLLFLVAGCSRSAERSASQSPPDEKRPAIFRTVHFEHVDVTLGQPLPNKAALGVALGDTAVQLARTRFGGAEAITIALAPGDTVRGMTYDYGSDTAFEARVATYANVLGPPDARWTLGTPGALQGDAVEWQDSLTRFELRWVMQNGTVVAQSELLDLRLARR